MVATEIVTAAATGAIVSEALDRTKTKEEELLELWREMRADIKAIRAFSQEERSRMPTVIPMQATYVAGVPQAGATIFNPQAPFNVKWLEVMSTVAGAISLLFGTRSEIYAFQVGGRTIYTPFNTHAQVTFGNDPTGAFASTVYIKLVGSYERQGTLDKGSAGD